MGCTAFHCNLFLHCTALCSPGRETPDLEICFAREVGDSPTCSGSGSGSSPAGSSIQNYVGGKKRKKLQGIGADNLQLVDTLVSLGHPNS